MHVKGEVRFCPRCSGQRPARGKFCECGAAFLEVTVIRPISDAVLAHAIASDSRYFSFEKVMARQIKRKQAAR